MKITDKMMLDFLIECQASIENYQGQYWVRWNLTPSTTEPILYRRSGRAAIGAAIRAEAKGRRP